MSLRHNTWKSYFIMPTTTDTYSENKYDRLEAAIFQPTRVLFIKMNMRENEEIETWEKLKNWKYNTYWIITFDITERIMMR